MNKNTYKILLAQWISASGNHVHQLALPLLIYQKTASSGNFALALLAETVPWVICAPFLAPYFQKFSSKNILIASDLLRAAICIFIAFYDWSEIQLFILMFLMGCCSSVYGAFRIQTARAIVQKSDLSKYLSLSNGGNEAISMIAPLLGATLITIGVSPKLFMLFDGITFILSVSLLIALPYVKVPERSDSERAVRNPLSLLKYVHLNKCVKAITASEGLRSIAEGIFIPAILTLMVQVQAFSESQYGWMRSCMAVAGVLSSYIFIKIEEKWSPARSHTISTLFILIGLVILPILPQIFVTLAAGFLIGLGMSFKQILSDKIVITQSVERFQAETITIINSVIASAYCIGYLISVKWDKPYHVNSLFYAAGIFLVLSLILGPQLNIETAVTEKSET